MPRKSLLIALLLLVTLLLWVASGHLLRPALTAGAATPLDAATSVHPLVKVELLTATGITRSLTNQGQTEPNRSVTVRAETEGTVEAVLVPRGSVVKAGDALVRLRVDTREVRLTQARANLAQREADFQSARDLAKDGFQSGNALRQAETALAMARAELKTAELERERMTIRAPFDGILNNRLVEVGDYVAVNTEVAHVVDNDPLVAAIDVRQQDVMQISQGQEATVTLRNGGSRKGLVRYLSSTADSGTRTFRVEVEVPNDQQPWLAGLSATVAMEVGSVQGHRVSPALLALDDANSLVVKTVDADNRVQLFPVEIVRNEAAGVWVTGLPETVRVITAGQGFVTRGQPVQVSEGGD